MIKRAVRLDVWRVARELFKPQQMPTREEYGRHGNFSERQVRNQSSLNTWNGTALAIDLIPNQRGGNRT